MGEGTRIGVGRIAAVAVSILLAGCINPGGNTYDGTPQGAAAYPGYGAPPPPPPPSYRSGPSLSRIQRDALSDGCQLRYSGNSRKLNECFHLGANWRDALAQGCEKRYSGVPRKLRECMDY